MVRRIVAAVLIAVCAMCLPTAAAEEKAVVLTFDDGPSGRFTRRLLDGLAERNVKATFLLCGYRIAQNPALAERIYEEGHEIGIHGYTHGCMGNMCEAQIVAEVNRTRMLLPPDCAPVFLRPPGGILNDAVCLAAKEANLALLTWSVDPRDWATQDVAAVQRAVVDQVRDGDVILMHDMSDSSVDAALAIVDRLQARGFTFYTASALITERGAIPQPGQVYTRFPEETAH